MDDYLFYVSIIVVSASVLNILIWNVRSNRLIKTLKKKRSIIEDRVNKVGEKIIWYGEVKEGIKENL
jgi:hypothetical protein